MHSLLVAIAFSIGLLEPSPSKPIEAAVFGAVVMQPNGTIDYEWPLASTAFLLTVRLDEVDLWMERGSFRAAFSIHQRRHGLTTGNCPLPNGPCFCLNGWVTPHPIDGMLTPAQWILLTHRLRCDAERTGDLTHIGALLERLSTHDDPQRSARIPYLTPLLLVIIDAASSGDTTCIPHAGQVRRLAEYRPGVFGLDIVPQAMDKATQRQASPDQVGALETLARSLGLERAVVAPAQFEWTTPPAQAF